MIQNDMMRPTYVSRDKYSKFVQQCKSENKNTRETLEKLLVIYINKGETLFVSRKKNILL